MALKIVFIVLIRTKKSIATQWLTQHKIILSSILLILDIR